MMYDLKSAKEILVVGAGLTGCVAAHVFAKKGWKVTVFDDRRPFAGTPPSAGVIHPAWVRDLDKHDVEDGLKTLDVLFKLRHFQVGKHDVVQLSPSKVMRFPPNVTEVYGTVDTVGNGWLSVKGKTYVGKVYVAAGSWCNELVNDMPRIDGRVGSAVLWEGTRDGFSLTEWAPYKQVMAFQSDEFQSGFDVMWSGDGTAMKPSNYTDEREQQTVDRVRSVLGLPGTAEPVAVIRGTRPYLKGSVGYFHQPLPYVWVATAGSKSGTIWAAIAAKRLWESING